MHPSKEGCAVLHSVTATKVGLIIEQLEQKRLNDLIGCHPSVPQHMVPPLVMRVVRRQKRLNDLIGCHPSVPQHMVPPLVRRVVRRKTTTALRQPAVQRRCRVPVTKRERGYHRHYARAPMVPVGHSVLPVGKGVAVMHSPALLHACMYATPTNAQPCRVLSKRLPIKPAGQWDNNRSGGHCFLCHVYLRSGDEWIEHFVELHSRGEKGSPDVGGSPGSANVGDGPGSADVGGGHGSADVDLTRFNKIAIQGTPQMAVDKEAICLSRVYSYYPKCNFPLFYV